MMAASLLVAIVAAVAHSITAGQQATHDALRQVRAMALAEAMIEEVLAQPYVDPDGLTPGPSGGALRGSFNSMADYHGLTEARGACADAQGLAYGPDYSPFSRSVTCAYGSVSISGLGSSITGLTITVVVRDNLGLTWTLSHFVASP